MIRLNQTDRGYHGRKNHPADVGSPGGKWPSGDGDRALSRHRRTRRARRHRLGYPNGHQVKGHPRVFAMLNIGIQVRI